MRKLSNADNPANPAPTITIFFIVTYLSIILYKGPISKAEIDQIRGVNSSYILRNLLIRGLVERKNLSGKTVYSETFDLMRYLGVAKKEDLPAYDKVIDKLNQIDKTAEEVFNKKENE